MENLLTMALAHAAEKTGINYNKANDYLKRLSYDKRFKLFILAATCVDNYNQSGIVKYMGRSYYYDQDGYKITLTQRNR